MRQQSKTERTRSAYTEQLKEVRTVGELLKFAETLPSDVGRPFTETLTAMTKHIWNGRKLIDPDELRARLRGKKFRMRRLTDEDSLYDIELLSAISVRVYSYAQKYNSPSDVGFVLEVLRKKELNNRRRWGLP